MALAPTNRPPEGAAAPSTSPRGPVQAHPTGPALRAPPPLTPLKAGWTQNPSCFFIFTALRAPHMAGGTESLLKKPPHNWRLGDSKAWNPREERGVSTASLEHSGWSEPRARQNQLGAGRALGDQLSPTPSHSGSENGQKLRLRSEGPAHLLETKCPGLRPEGSKLLADWASIPRNEHTCVHPHASRRQNVSVHACFATSVVSDSSPPCGL